ncbi:MAG: arginine--tRNA ligase [Planctomycetota bacterium]|nr:MAG: arginine--tRNA ligase [Planctomycetota bacterium]
MLQLLAQPIADTIAQHLDLPVHQVADLLGPPSRPALDLALPCFVLAKAKGLPPPQLAAQLAEVLNAQPGLTAQAAGPFLNIGIDPALVARTLVPPLVADPRLALRSTSGQGQRVCIDFSSPNIAKHLAFHHIRSTMLGNALSRCYAACGWQVTRINFLGDWGTAFGRLIAGWMREGFSLADLDGAEDPVTFLNELYVRISQAAKADPQVAEEARAWSRRLEDGDSTARELWQLFKEASLRAFRKVYALLGVDFDSWKGEAFYEDKMQPVLSELQQRGLLVEDQGALVVDLSEQGFKKPCLIQRADGGSLYATRDLAACDDRFAEFAFDRSLYVVDLGQSLHFQEWFAVAGRLGRPYVDRLRHVGFGVVLMWNDESQGWAKTATRNGVPMLLVDVLEEAVTRARAVVDEKNPDLDEAEKAAVAEAVGMGAVIFNDLKSGRRNDVKFRFEDALNMQGETGPYLQYAHARLCSIERRFGDTYPGAAVAEADPGLLTLAQEKSVLLALAQLQKALDKVVAEDEPSALAQALLNLAATVSSWLSAGNAERSARVLCDDAAVAASRCQLVGVVRACLAEGLQLLGLRAPERM